MRKRSRYRPKPIVRNPLDFVQPVDETRRNRLMARYYSSLECMVNNQHPGELEWRQLADLINVVETLATQGKIAYAEAMPSVCDAIEAMVHASDRFKSGKGMRLDGEGIVAIRAVIDIYSQCAEGFTGYEMSKAHVDTQERIFRTVINKASNTVRVTV